MISEIWNSPLSKWNTELSAGFAQQQTMPSDEVEFRVAFTKFMKQIRYFARENLSNALMARRWSAAPARQLALYVGRAQLVVRGGE